LYLMTIPGALTCPSCLLRTPEPMPTNACLRVFECPGCGALLRPKAGDCCVFCSYGDEPCPPRQAATASCCRTEPPESARRSLLGWLDDSFALLDLSVLVILIAAIGYLFFRP
jgi:hypothetical protein